MKNNLQKIYHTLNASGGKCIRILKTPNNDDTIEWWSIEGKLIIIQYWGNGDILNCFKPLQNKNDISREIQALKYYINN